MPLLIIFMVFFAVELALFIEVGGELGVFVTLLWIVLSAMLGGQLIRRAGWGLLQTMQRGGMSHWWLRMQQQTAMRQMLAGLLLAMPGFATDTLGVLLLVWSFIGPRSSGPREDSGFRQGPDVPPNVGPSQGETSATKRGEVIEGEYKREK